MERLNKIQGFIAAHFLSGYSLDKLGLFDEYGFDSYYRTLFDAIKKQYNDIGTIDLSTLNFSFEKAIGIIDEFGFLSLSIDSCIKQINENAINKKIDEISNMLKVKQLTPVEAAKKLNELNTFNESNAFDVSKISYQSQLDSKTLTIETGIYIYDRHVEDWKLGELTVLFGRNGEGKTTLISQVIAHNLSKGVKTFLYSGEMSETKIQSWLYHQVVGVNKDAYINIETKYGIKRELKKNVIEAIKEWHKETFYLYNRNTKRITRELDRLFDTMESCAKNGIKLFVIDNIMSALEENADSLYSDQANFVQRCKDFVVKNNVHLVLMAHPNKEKKEITNEKGNLEKTDISGSNNIPNKADNIIAVERVWNDESEIDLIITSLKDRESGQRKVIPMMFSKETLRFYDATTKPVVNYGWKQYLKPEEQTLKYHNGTQQTFKNGEFEPK